MQEHYFAERGIAYRTNNFKPERRTLVFVHGLSGSLSAWYPFEKLFEEKYNLITLDLRGHGFSARPNKSGYAMAQFVEDIRALLTHLHIERSTMISHSFGTLVAMEYARTYPATLEHSIFLAPAYAVHTFRATRLLTNLAAALAILPLRMRAFGRTNYAPFNPTPDYGVRRIGTDLLNMGLRSYVRCMRVIFARDYTADWQDVSTPVLIIHGNKDSIVPVSHAQALAKALSQARLVEIKGANHILVLNNIEEVAGEIEKFVQQ